MRPHLHPIVFAALTFQACGPDDEDKTTGEQPAATVTSTVGDAAIAKGPSRYCLVHADQRTWSELGLARYQIVRLEAIRARIRAAGGPGSAGVAAGPNIEDTDRTPSRNVSPGKARNTDQNVDAASPGTSASSNFGSGNGSDTGGTGFHTDTTGSTPHANAGPGL